MRRRRKKIPKNICIENNNMFVCQVRTLSLSGKTISGDEVLTLSNIFKAEQFYVQLFVKKKKNLKINITLSLQTLYTVNCQ